MSERIRGSYDDALYKSTYTLLNVVINCPTKPYKCRYIMLGLLCEI